MVSITIKVKISLSLIQEYDRRKNMTTVNVIKCILNDNKRIKTDIADINKVAVKDLYIVENEVKRYCVNCYMDNIDNIFKLQF